MERFTGEDLRQQRTRRFLVGALLELLEEKSFQELSVVDVCQRAMVHRTTFYAHFEDKRALLRYALSTVLRELESQSAGRAVEDSRAFFMEEFRTVLAFTESHPGLCRAVLSAGGGERRLLEDLVAGELERALSSPERQALRPGLLPQAAARFYAGAILALVRWWLEADRPLPRQALAEQLEYLIPLPAGQVQKG